MKKNIIYVVVGLIALVVIIWATSPRPATSPEVNNQLTGINQEIAWEADTSEILLDGTYQFIPEASQLMWESRKTLIANYKNQGTIDISSGMFTLENQQITTGSLVFNMEGLKVTSMTTIGSEAQLTRHLKSEDFFSVENYPEAELIINQGVANLNDAGGQLYDVNASLTIKGITQTIDFPVMLYQLNNQAVVEGAIELDRTLWDIRFGSDKFFDNLADNVIDDNFLVVFRVVAQVNN